MRTGRRLARGAGPGNGEKERRIEDQRMGKVAGNLTMAANELENGTLPVLWLQTRDRIASLHATDDWLRAWHRSHRIA